MVLLAQQSNLKKNEILKNSKYDRRPCIPLIFRSPVCSTVPSLDGSPSRQAVLVKHLQEDVWLLLCLCVCNVFDTTYVSDTTTAWLVECFGGILVSDKVMLLMFTIVLFMFDSNFC